SCCPTPRSGTSAPRCDARPAGRTWATCSRARGTTPRPTSAGASTRSRCAWCPPTSEREHQHHGGGRRHHQTDVVQAPAGQVALERQTEHGRREDRTEVAERLEEPARGARLA